MYKKGFTLVEVMIGIGLAGLLIVMLCGVFVYGLNAIEKGRLRSTALNLAERKISEAHNIIRASDNGYISGEILDRLISDNKGTITYDGTAIDLTDPDYNIDLWNVTGNTIRAEGTTVIRGTADYDYIFTMEDSSYYLAHPDMALKKITVEISWKEERVGGKKSISGKSRI